MQKYFEYFSDTPDFHLLRQGSLNFYYKDSILRPDLDWLRDNGYRIVIFDCSAWKTMNHFHTTISLTLDFPDYYGKNLDAFNDCIGDVVIKEIGIVLVFKNFELMLERLGKYFTLNLLDILEQHSRSRLLFGERMITILRTNKPGLNLYNFGKSSVLWNSKESLYTARGITEKDVGNIDYTKLNDNDFEEYKNLRE
jgi:RNAse (barnase) inhibitor barstar